MLVGCPWLARENGQISRLKQFVIVLTDGKSEFALTLETLALKKSVNIHIFKKIKTELDARLLEAEGYRERPAKERKAKTDKHILRNFYFSPES